MLLYHLMALVTVVIWGTTFVSTKYLINNGLSPIEILFYRFGLAYICILIVSRKKLWANNIKDECLLLASGLCGGSLYFIAENTALAITLASNVSLIICTAPIITAFLSLLYKKEHVRRNLLFGSFIALIGVALVIFNGNMTLKIKPMGDLLTLAAATLWAFYCLILKRLSVHYSTLFITRRVFFYGILSLLFFFLFQPITIHMHILIQPIILMNLLFLGIIASLLCYIMWNLTVKKLGAVQTTNYIYVVPLITLVTSAIVLKESITVFSIMGSICIIGGVYIAERH